MDKSKLNADLPRAPNAQIVLVNEQEKSFGGL